MVKNKLREAVSNYTMTSGKVSWIEVQNYMEAHGFVGSTERWRSMWRRMRPKGKKLVSKVGIEQIEARKALGENIEVWFENGELWCETKPKLPIGTTEVAHITKGRELHIPVVSDTHIGHEKSAISELREFY